MKYIRVFRAGNGRESGCGFDVMGPDARRRRRFAGNRCRGGGRRIGNPQPERDEPSRKHRGQRYYARPAGYAGGIRTPRADRNHDAQEDCPRQRYRVECGFVGCRRLRTQRTAGPSLLGQGVSGIRHDGRGADRRHAPCRQCGSCGAGRRGAGARIRAVRHRPAARARQLLLRRGASRHRGQHEGCPRGPAARDSPVESHHAEGQRRGTVAGFALRDVR